MKRPTGRPQGPSHWCPACNRAAFSEAELAMLIAVGTGGARDIYELSETTGINSRNLRRYASRHAWAYLVGRPGRRTIWTLSPAGRKAFAAVTRA